MPPTVSTRRPKFIHSVLYPFVNIDSRFAYVSYTNAYDSN